jgi:hypothetical protein
VQVPEVASWNLLKDLGDLCIQLLNDFHMNMSYFSSVNLLVVSLLISPSNLAISGFSGECSIVTSYGGWFSIISFLIFSLCNFPLLFLNLD